VSVFIISWAGQHENARLIAEQILKITSNVTIVYSDPDPNFFFNISCNLIRRSNDLFWADKFKSCLDATDDDGMLVIHADCSCEDWRILVNRCSEVQSSISDIGVWAPKINGTPFHVSVSGIFRLKNSKLILSALTDGIFFYISNQIVDRMRQVSYGRNKFGWAIDCLFCTAAHNINKLVVIDTEIEVIHPSAKRGYDANQAKIQSDEFLNQFTSRERLLHQLLANHVSFNRFKLAAQTRKKTIRSDS